MAEQPFLDYVLNMTNLKDLRLEGCSLTGALPDDFGQLDELTRCARCKRLTASEGNAMERCLTFFFIQFVPN